MSFFAEAEPSFVSAIVTRLKFEVYLERDVIIHEGELGLEMYFLKEGTVHVIRRGRVATILHDGDFFGGASPDLSKIFRKGITQLNLFKTWNLFLCEVVTIGKISDCQP